MVKKIKRKTSVKSFSRLKGIGHRGIRQAGKSHGGSHDNARAALLTTSTTTTTTTTTA